jgi:capsular polysaccharide biosynthesis protein
MNPVAILVRVLLVGVIAVLVGLAALLFSRAQPARYEAVAKMSFTASTRPELQVLGAAFVRPATDPRTASATNAALVSSYRVAREVSRARPELRLSPDDVAGRVSVSPVGSSELIQVSASGDTPAAARQLASAYVEEFQRWYRNRERTRAASVRRVLSERYAGLPASSRRSDTGASLRNQISALDVLEQVGSGSPDVVEGAHAFRDREQPKTKRNVIFGLLFGAALGVGLVALRSELRRGAAPTPREGV